MSNYNVPHGKKTRGMLCVAAYKRFTSGKDPDDFLRSANLVGWAIEFVLICVNFILNVVAIRLFSI